MSKILIVCLVAIMLIAAAPIPPSEVLSVNPESVKFGDMFSYTALVDKAPGGRNPAEFSTECVSADGNSLSFTMGVSSVGKAPGGGALVVSTENGLSPDLAPYGAMNCHTVYSEWSGKDKAFIPALALDFVVNP